MKKTLSMLLAMLMPFGCLAACTPAVDPGPQTDPEITTEPKSSTEPEQTTEPEETVPDTGYPVDLFEIGGVAFSEFSLFVQPSAAKGSNPTPSCCKILLDNSDICSTAMSYVSPYTSLYIDISYYTSIFAVTTSLK